MTKREAMEITATENRLLNIGISRADAESLRRISMTLRRWFEMECGTDNGCVERDDETNKPYWVSSWGSQWTTGKRCRTPIADRETGARKRLALIMARYPTLIAYVQGDPRGYALYILTPDQLTSEHGIDSIYNRGIAIG